ncbi:collagen-like protein [Mesomycoplasma lagogenitalium]|uniref:Collagen-like protein n=1 Tax=Mesomycoplasma lagogenitalium TaxID=171286 RepID=A0ABY8LTB1_9BACT|nr:collagen-like protein [Mesomycoplasma lagogenitalium]WGI36485.1 collagen-like protein [Mesomycoplasma lagogenitalium]
MARNNRINSRNYKEPFLIVKVKQENSHGLNLSTFYYHKLIYGSIMRAKDLSTDSTSRVESEKISIKILKTVWSVEINDLIIRANKIFNIVSVDVDQFNIQEQKIEAVFLSNLQDNQQLANYLKNVEELKEVEKNVTNFLTIDQFNNEKNQMEQNFNNLLNLKQNSLNENQLNNLQMNHNDFATNDNLNTIKNNLTNEFNKNIKVINQEVEKLKNVEPKLLKQINLKQNNLTESQLDNINLNHDNYLNIDTFNNFKNEVNNKIIVVENKVPDLLNEIEENKQELETVKVDLSNLSNKLTEENFLNSIKGEKGDKGEQGERGEKGEKGDKGDGFDSAQLKNEIIKVVNSFAVDLGSCYDMYKEIDLIRIKKIPQIQWSNDNQNIEKSFAINISELLLKAYIAQIKRTGENKVQFIEDLYTIIKDSGYRLTYANFRETFTGNSTFDNRPNSWFRIDLGRNYGADEIEPNSQAIKGKILEWLDNLPQLPNYENIAHYKHCTVRLRSPQEAEKFVHAEAPIRRRGN